MDWWRNKKGISWWRTSSRYSTRLFLLVVPLVVVFGVVGLRGSKGYNRVFAPDYYRLAWSSGAGSSTGAAAASGGGAGEEYRRAESSTSDEGAGENNNGVHVDYAEMSWMVAAGGATQEAAAVTSDDNVSRRSALPPMVPEAGKDPPSDVHGVNRSQISPPVAKVAAVEQQSTNHSMKVVNIFPSMNDTHSVLLERQGKRRFGSLEKLEARLGLARAAIQEARDEDHIYNPEYVPLGPIYRNAKAFHRSYLEMEKQFKVYVYEEGEPPIFHHGPCKSIYAMEGNFIYQMETTSFRTRDPEKAHIFFLPISATAIVRFIYESKSHEWDPMKQTVRDYINLIAAKYLYWNRSLGADHFMLACHDWGPELSSSVPELFKNSIRALCNANISEGFKPSKDVSFPEILLPGGTIKGLIGGPSPSKRPILVFFAGGLHGPVRPILLQHWENKDPDIQVHRYLPEGVSYYGMLRKSKYCICPSGYEVASPRMVEALYTGCVPVLIKDNYVPPFSDVLNWKAFSVKVPVEDIPNLKNILTGISTRQYIRMQRRCQQVRRHFEVNLPPKRYDVFHMILHSVWLRRLNIQLNDMQDA